MLTFFTTGTTTPKTDPAVVEPIQETQMVSKYSKHDHEPDYESTLSAKMKADLCQKAADNPTLSMKEVYNQYMDSADTPLDDDHLEPQL